MVRGFWTELCVPLTLLQVPLLVLLLSLAGAVVTPISAAKIGRHTIYTNGQSSGACNYGMLLSPMGPGFLQIAALNDFTDDGFGFQGSQACGTCYQVTGIGGSTKLMVTDSCPDCPTRQPHFDMSPEAAADVDGGRPGGGNTAVTFRKVTCGFAGNVLVQQHSASSLFFMRAQVAHHNTPLKGTITVQENGRPPVVVTRTTFGFWDWNPNNAQFPITITVEDIFGNTITAVWPTHSPGQIVDSGRQFPEPLVGTGGGQSNCPGGVCPAPLINNGQLVIFEDSTFPQRTAEWTPLTQHAWMWFSGSLAPVASPVFSGAASGSTTLSNFGEIHLGCNVQTPKSEVAFVTLAIRMRPGVTSPGLQWWSSTGAHVPMNPSPNGNAWTQYWLPIAGNPNVPGNVFSDLQIQHMSSNSLEYFVDNFYFVLSDSALATPCQPFNYPQPSQPVGAATTAAPTTPPAATTTTVAATTTTRPTTTVAATTTTTAAAGGTTTTVAGGTTTTTTRQTTTVAGTTTTTRQTTTAAGGGTTTTRATTTPQTTTTTTTTATSAACVPPTAAPVRVPCTIQCCPPTAGRTLLTFTLATDYDSFNCLAFEAEASGALRSSTFRICGYRRGSTIVDAEVEANEADALFAAGALPLPVTDFRSVVDPASGRSVAAPSSFPIWIVAVILAVLVLVAAAIVLFLCWRRRKAAHAHHYAPLSRGGHVETAAEYSSFPAAAAAAAAPAAAASSGLVCMTLLHDVVDVADGVLNGKRGDICFVERSDLATKADWVWVRIGHQNGYVPHSYLAPK